MQRTLLQGIKRRAERLALAQVEDETPSLMADIAVLEQDRGRYRGFVRMIGTRR